MKAASGQHARRPSVAYFPPFRDVASLTNHYHRACWYLPFKDKVLEKVWMGVDGPLSPGRRPDHMCASRQRTDHIALVADRATYLRGLAEASMVLVWRPVADDPVVRALAARGAVILNVDTDDVSAQEYGRYCSALWRLMSADQRAYVANNSHRLFCDFGETVRARGYRAACVFGTGPSIDQAFGFDFAPYYTHVCNSIVQSERLMDHIQPDLISAGDAVSHFGISKYAERFRADLSAYLTASGKHLLTTSSTGYLFKAQYPEVADQVLVCDHGPPLPNFDLEQDWWLPALDSVLNIHMLPAAATFFDEIFVLGCDGKHPDPAKNEDFWGHSTLAQYHDLVGAGHLCHPTFDARRQENTWMKYQDSVRITLGVGEARYGKRYFSLAPSFTPMLAERYRPTL
jgi:hypothetical protein